MAEEVSKPDRSKKKCILDRKDKLGIVEFNLKQIEALGLDPTKNDTHDLRELVHEKCGVKGIVMRVPKEKEKTKEDNGKKKWTLLLFIFYLKEVLNEYTKFP